MTDAFPDAWGLYSNHRFHQSFTRYPSIGTVPDYRNDNDRLVEVYLRFVVLGATASSGVVAYKRNVRSSLTLRCSDPFQKLRSSDEFPIG